LNNDGADETSFFFYLAGKCLPKHTAFVLPRENEQSSHSACFHDPKLQKRDGIAFQGAA
jgi:hypothetical protein